MKKKILIALGVLAGLFVLLAALVPVFVKVDQYRPLIVKAANERLNGNLELGKLKLSLWGKIRIEIGGVKLTDSRNRTVLSVNDAWFHVPFSSILGGSPELTLHLDRPEVAAVKDKAGQMNVLGLMKESAATPGAPTGSQAQPRGQEQAIALPALATRARLGVDVREAQISYVDEASQLSSRIQDLNLRIKDLSLSRPTEIQLSAFLDTRMGKSLVVKGPARLDGQLETRVEAGRVDGISARFKADLDDLVISMPGTFEKKKGLPANAEVAFQGSSSRGQFEKVRLRFFNAELEGSGGLTQAAPGAPLALQLKLKSNAVDLKPWTELLPALKDTELAGTMSFDAAADGPVSQINYRANLAVKELTAKAPGLKAQPRFDAQVKVSTDQIESFLLTLKAPANDLRISGNVKSFRAPRLQMEVTSTGMDLDQLVQWPAPGKKAEAAALSQGDSGKAGAPAADFDALLEPLRQSPIALATTGLATLDLKFVQAYGVRMNDIRGRMALQDLTASLDKLTMGLFRGQVSASATVALKPKAPTYRFNSKVDGLELQDAVASQFHLFKDTLLGKANFSMEGSGSSFNPDPAKRNLSAKGSLKVTNATFATLDVGRMAAEAVNRAIDRIGEKVPAIKGKGLKSLPPKESKYEFITSDFSIGGGRFSAPNFTTKSLPNAGIDLKGSTQVGLLDLSLKAEWEVIDTWNQLKARDLSVEVAGTPVPHVLAEGNGPVRFPVSVGGTVLQPTFSYTQVPETLGKIALSNVSQAASGRLQAEARKKAQGLLQGATRNASPAIQNALKGLFGR